MLKKHPSKSPSKFFVVSGTSLFGYFRRKKDGFTLASFPYALHHTLCHRNMSNPWSNNKKSPAGKLTYPSLRKGKSSTQSAFFWGRGYVHNRSQESSHQYSEKVIQFAVEMEPIQVSHEKKKTLTFHCTGCLIGILIMVYYNPLNTLNNQWPFFIAQVNSLETDVIHPWYCWLVLLNPRYTTKPTPRCFCVSSSHFKITLAV